MTDLHALAAASEALEASVGHPGERWTALVARVQEQAVTQFSSVEDEWLSLMWSMDAYRIAGIPPRSMGRPDVDEAARLGAIYRTKGNWFATLVALLLQNRTSQQIQPRTKVRGFSQMHQIDVAWPVREDDVLVCAETKVTGAPAYGSTSARGALSDFSNRRKELKFAATDLKLYRRDLETQIEHWGVWRENTPPKTYFLWAARLRTGGKAGDDTTAQLAVEAQALVHSYLDGAGLVAWRVNPDASGYELADLPAGASVSRLDDVLYRIASEISLLVRPSGRPPEPIRPKTRAVAVERLTPDTSD